MNFKFEISNSRLKRPALRRLLLAFVVFFLTADCLLPTAYCFSWERQKTGTMAWLRAVFFVDERRGWAVGGRGALLSTEDGGVSWRPLRAPTEDNLRDAFFLDARRGWLVCEREWFKLATKTEPRAYLLKTSDGGATWARVEAAGPDVDARLVGVRFADAEHGWAFGEMGALYVTSDGGATWARQLVPTRKLLLGAHFADARRGWIVGAGATLLYTSDGGATWLAGQLSSQAAPRLNAVTFVDSRRGWAAGSGGAVYSTSDGGRTWAAQNSGVASDLYDVKFLDEREGWAAGAAGTLIHTTDGGRTWAAEASGTPQTLERLFFASRTRGWAVGFGGTIIGFVNRQS
ncbi:MAG TPA: YCF48-related protein [Pyrinomonadaceae bacterium]|jgi:photosystem II stability/assembly factor-like uncharacterized protein|nr:YCF48-related protein [Pyrinomonadaceae bacterium]